jgi:hypothetical protein
MSVRIALEWLKALVMLPKSLLNILCGCAIVLTWVRRYSLGTVRDYEHLGKCIKHVYFYSDNLKFSDILFEFFFCIEHVRNRNFFV